MKHYSYIIWDWNGTLADDVGASLRSDNDILKKRGKPPITLAQYHSYIDTPISRFYEHLFDLNEVPMEVIAQEFQENYTKYFDSLHQGTLELLEDLQKAGIHQVILSSAHRDQIEQDTARFGIRDYFEEIIGAEDLMATGKVERAKAWIARQSASPSEMVMIGDTLHDFDTAQAMGTDCILAAIGHQSEADLKKAGVPVVTAFSQLRGLLLPEKVLIAK
jgi:phosphoglycolate phosphatase